MLSLVSQCIWRYKQKLITFLKVDGLKFNSKQLYNNYILTHTNILAVLKLTAKFKLFWLYDNYRSGEIFNTLYNAQPCRHK